MKIGLIGCGTVGEGVLKLLSEQEKKMKGHLGEEIEVVIVCDRVKKPLPYGDYSYTSECMEVVEEERVDTVVELIGGVDTAYDVAKKTLSLGKTLVTANKHLIATHGRELFDLARDNNCTIYYEAAVGGGIPVVAPLKEGLFLNDFKRVRGILNGTCNYMLSKMEEGMSYEEALKDAKDRGYAEADSTFDIKGIDTGHKISILAYLAWGELVDFESVIIEGIDDITREDMEGARKEGKRYKLLGEAWMDEEEGLSVRVGPALVEDTELLYQVGGVYNAVEIEGSYTGKTVLYGEGAGMEATATAVLSDLMRAHREAVADGGRVRGLRDSRVS